jgi:outer membrane murein-binding lipoprotein Lpp
MVEEITEAVNEEIKEEIPAAVKEETKEEVTETPPVKVPEFKKPLDKMTAIELREVALEIPGVEGVHAMKKEELLPIIREYYGIEEEGGVAKGKKKKVQKAAASIQELKAKMSQLRGKREAIRAARDRKQADTLRRRINRLKKQTRKAAQG